MELLLEGCMVNFSSTCGVVFWNNMRVADAGKPVPLERRRWLFEKDAGLLF